MTQLNSSLKEWGAVTAHADELKRAHLRDLTAADPKGWQSFHVLHDSWLLDMSRQRITANTLPLLFDLARAADLPGRRAAMFRGDPINSTEQRAVLHTALRSDFAGSAAVQAEVRDTRKKLVDFVAAVRSGRKLGTTGKKFKHVVNIGIGGSDLGPLLVCDALKHEWSGGITPHFVSNVDRTQLEDLIRSIDPAETLVIVCSKTFVTQETQANANAGRAWIVGALGWQSPANHFVARSTMAAALYAFASSTDRPVLVQHVPQGTVRQAWDVVVARRGCWGRAERQDLALQNCFAQSQAFAFGYSLQEVEADIAKAGADPADVGGIVVHLVHE